MHIPYVCTIHGIVDVSWYIAFSSPRRYGCDLDLNWSSGMWMLQHHTRMSKGTACRRCALKATTTTAAAVSTCVGLNSAAGKGEILCKHLTDLIHCYHLSKISLYAHSSHSAITPQRIRYTRQTRPAGNQNIVYTDGHACIVACQQKFD